MQELPPLGERVSGARDDGPAAQPRSPRALALLGVATLAALLACPNPAFAQATWTGSSDGLWSNASNWTGTAPTASGTRSFVFNGPGNLSGTNDLSGLTASSMTFNTAGFWLSGSSITLTGTVAAAVSGTQRISLDMALTSRRTISGTDGAAIILDGNYSGSGGSFLFQRLGTTGTFTVTLGGSTGFVGTSQVSTNGVLVNLASAAALGSGTLQMGTSSGLGSVFLDNTSGGPLTIATNILNWNVGGAGWTFVGTNDLTTTGTLFSNGSKSVTVRAGMLSANGVEVNVSTSGMTKEGAGTLRLTGPSGPVMAGGTGGFNVNGGTLVIAHPQAITTGGTLRFASSAGATATELVAATDLTGTNALAMAIDLGGQADRTTMSGSYGVTLTGTVVNNRTSRTLVNNLTSGMLRIEGGLVLANTTANRTLFLDGSGETVISGQIGQTSTGTGSLVKNGAGTLTLSASNVYSGSTALNAGTLNLGHASALGTGTFVISGGTLGNSSGGALSIANPLGPLGGTLTFAGPQPLRLAAETLNAGTLAANAARTINVLSSTLTVGGLFTGTSNRHFTKTGAGTLVVTGSSNYGVTTIDGGTLQVGDGGTTGLLPSGTGGVSVASGATLAFNRSDNLTYSGMVTGAGGLTKLGAGLVTLTGSSSFTGPTTISEGTLALGSGAFLQSNFIKVGETAGSGAVLSLGKSLDIGGGKTLGGYGTVSGSAVVIANSGVISPGGSVGAITIGNLEFGKDGVYTFEVNDATGSAGGLLGNGWDLVTVSSAFSLTADIADPFVISLVSLSGTASGFAANFDTGGAYQWRFLAAPGEIANFNAAYFAINASGFLNPTSGNFSIARGDAVGGTSSELYVVYAGVPEPTSLVLAGIGLAFATRLAGRRWKRRHA